MTVREPWSDKSLGRITLRRKIRRARTGVRVDKGAVDGRLRGR